jgi:hypothetical protein
LPLEARSRPVEWCKSVWRLACDFVGSHYAVRAAVAARFWSGLSPLLSRDRVVPVSPQISLRAENTPCPRGPRGMLPSSTLLVTGVANRLRLRRFDN